MAGLVADLPVGETQVSEPCGGMYLVSNTVPGLLCGRTVIAKAVRLDDQAEIGPVKVDLETIHSGLRLRYAKARAPRDGQEATLELGVREYERGAVKKGPERPNALLALPPIEIRP